MYIQIKNVKSAQSKLKHYARTLNCMNEHKTKLPEIM